MDFISCRSFSYLYSDCLIHISDLYNFPFIATPGIPLLLFLPFFLLQSFFKNIVCRVCLVCLIVSKVCFAKVAQNCLLKICLGKFEILANFDRESNYCQIFLACPRIGNQTWDVNQQAHNLKALSHRIVMSKISACLKILADF